jgi:DNA-binding transcriptional regulator of glucitol operon
VGVLAALSSCILAWLQVKKYQETAQSYSIAHDELGLIETLAANIRSEEALATFVQDAENAVSREHTLWIAKRAMR